MNEIVQKIIAHLRRYQAAAVALIVSIRNKGVDVPDGTRLDALAAYVDKIKALNIPDMTDASYFFSGGARYADMARFAPILKDAVNAKCMFSDYPYTYYVLDASCLDLSKVEDIQGIYRACYSQKIIHPASGFPSVKNASNFVSYGNNLTEGIDLSCFKDAHPEILDNFIAISYSHFKKVDLTPINTDKCTSMTFYLYGCNYLEEIIGFSAVGVNSQPGQFLPYTSSSSHGKIKRFVFKDCGDKPAYKFPLTLRYNSIEREGMVEMFQSLPDLVRFSISAKNITITGNPCVTDGTLTDADRAIATAKGWTLVE